jgi:Gliding motility associated protein GldN
MKNLFCFFLLHFASASYAQLTDLMQDKNVAWIADYSKDVRLDMLPEAQIKALEDMPKNTVDNRPWLLKILANETVDNNGDAYYFFANTLMTAVKNKEITVYADSLCSQVLDAGSATSRRETVSYFNSVTKETKTQDVYLTTQYEEILLFRVHQIVYYMPKTSTWGVKNISIAPLIQQKNQNGDFVGWKPLFWIKVEHQKADLAVPNITWATVTAKDCTVDVTTAKTYKKTSADMPCTIFSMPLKKIKFQFMGTTRGMKKQD